MRTTTMISILLLAVAFTKTNAVNRKGGGPPKKSKLSKGDNDFEDDEKWDEQQKQHQADLKAIEALQRILWLC